MSEEGRVPEFLEGEQAKELIRVIDLGLEATAFVGSPLGRQMIADAEKEREDLVARLIKANATRPDEIVPLQQGIWAIDSWQQQLANYIARGELAQKELEALENTD